MCTSCASNFRRTDYFRYTGNWWDPPGGSKPWSCLYQRKNSLHADLRVNSYIKIKQSFESQCFPILTYLDKYRSRVWPVNHLYRLCFSLKATLQWRVLLTRTRVKIDRSNCLQKRLGDIKRTSLRELSNFIVAFQRKTEIKGRKVKCDHRSKFSNLSNWKEEAWKKSGLQRDSNPNFFFQASSFQLLKLENLLRWSHFTFIYNRSTNMNYFIYISHENRNSLTTITTRQGELHETKGNYREIQLLSR